MAHRRRTRTSILAAALLLSATPAAPCPAAYDADVQRPPGLVGTVHPVTGAALPPTRLSRRLDDRALGLTDWQACDDVSQCVAVDNGCLLSAVHRDFLLPARERAWARGGDPRAMSCEPRVRNDLVLACVERRCGAWRVAPATR